MGIIRFFIAKERKDTEKMLISGTKCNNIDVDFSLVICYNIPVII